MKVSSQPIELNLKLKSNDIKLDQFEKDKENKIVSISNSKVLFDHDDYNIIEKKVDSIKDKDNNITKAKQILLDEEYDF